MNLWAKKYIGKKWVSGARGPDTFDCWGLLYWAMREDFKTEVPEFPINPMAILKVQRQMDSEAKSLNWIKLDKPIEGCATGLSHGVHFHHVGMYTEADGGLVIHCMDGSGVVAHTLRQLRDYHWNRIEFYAPSTWLT